MEWAERCGENALGIQRKYNQQCRWWLNVQVQNKNLSRKVYNVWPRGQAADRLIDIHHEHCIR
jgi:hypothetical protein